MPTAGEVEIQRQYYAATAQQYDAMHVGEKDEHSFALSFLSGMLEHLDARSVLDVGSGTGRAIRFLKRRRPELRIVGLEPVQALRDVGHAQGLGRDELVDGDATALPFADGEFDLACEFGMLHHVRHPQLAVREMLRVARKAVFISDSNNFGQGSSASRLMKQFLNAVGAWRLADLIKTGGKGYSVSDGDGLAYSYSVFNNHALIREHCASVHVVNTMGAGVNPYRSAGHVALLGVKRPAAS